LSFYAYCPILLGFGKTLVIVTLSYGLNQGCGVRVARSRGFWVESDL